MILRGCFSAKFYLAKMIDFKAPPQYLLIVNRLALNNLKYWGVSQQLIFKMSGQQNATKYVPIVLIFKILYMYYLKTTIAASFFILLTVELNAQIKFKDFLTIPSALDSKKLSLATSTMTNETILSLLPREGVLHRRRITLWTFFTKMQRAIWVAPNV